MGQAKKEKTSIRVSRGRQEILLPYVQITGAQDGPTLAVIAGVHGSEYAGIEAAIRLSQEIREDSLRGRVRIIPALCTPGFFGRKEALCPVDNKNMNRIWPGDPAGTFSDVVVYEVWAKVVKDADCVLNVHGGDIFEALVPYTGVGKTDNPELDRKCRELGRTYDFPFLVEFAGMASPSEPGKGSLNRIAQAQGIVSILAEAGGEGVLREEDVQKHLKGFRNVLRWLGMMDGQIFKEEEVKELVSDFWRAPLEGIFYPSLELGQYVKKGEEIGLLRDFYGDVIQTLPAPRDAYIIAIVTTPAARKDAIIYQVAY